MVLRRKQIKKRKKALEMVKGRDFSVSDFCTWRAGEESAVVQGRYDHGDDTVTGAAAAVTGGP